jgi:hypothetical protein
MHTHIHTSGDRRIKNVVMVLDVIPNNTLYEERPYPSWAGAFQTQNNTGQSHQASPALLGGVDASLRTSDMSDVDRAGTMQLENMREHTSDLVRQLWDVIQCCNTEASSNAEAVVDVSALLYELMRAACAVDQDIITDPQDSEFNASAVYFPLIRVCDAVRALHSYHETARTRVCVFWCVCDAQPGFGLIAPCRQCPYLHVWCITSLWDLYTLKLLIVSSVRVTHTRLQAYHARK